MAKDVIETTVDSVEEDKAVLSIVKIYYTKIVRTKGEYSVADIASVDRQRDVVTYAKTQLVAGRISKMDYDAWFAPYESALGLAE